MTIPLIQMSFPPHSNGEVSASYAGGGGRSYSIGGAHDPSVAGYRGTSPFEWGGFADHRDSWITSLIFSSVLVRLAVQPSSSYLVSLTCDIGGMLPGSLVRSTSARVGRRKVALRIISRTSLRLM